MHGKLSVMRGRVGEEGGGLIFARFLGLNSKVDL